MNAVLERLRREFRDGRTGAAAEVDATHNHSYEGQVQHTGETDDHEYLHTAISNSCDLPNTREKHENKAWLYIINTLWHSQSYRR